MNNLGENANNNNNTQYKSQESWFLRTEDLLEVKNTNFWQQAKDQYKREQQAKINDPVAQAVARQLDRQDQQQDVPVQPKIHYKYKTDSGKGFNPSDIKNYNIVVEGTYHSFLDKLGVILLIFICFPLSIIWYFFSKDKFNQFGLIFKDGSRGLITIKGKYKITAFVRTMNKGIWS